MVQTKYIIVLISSLLTLSCGKSFNNQNFGQASKEVINDENDEQILPPKKESIDEACYFNEGSNNESCVPTTALSQEQIEDEYSYADPYDEEIFPKSFSPAQYITPDRLIPLSEVLPSIYLTKNFQINELMQIEKGALAIFSPTVLNYIQNMRNDLNKPILIHSAYRSPAYNSALNGSAKWSRHMYGDAIDFHVEGTSNSELQTLCAKHGASFAQAYKNHVHCDWRNTPLSEHFYKNPPITPTSFINIRSVAELKSKIKVNITNNKFKLSVETDYIEDDRKQITYLWEVKYKSKVKTYSTPTITLKPRKHKYSVKVLLGGSIELSKIISAK